MRYKYFGPLGRVAGLALVLATLISYRSVDHRVVADRWSLEFASVILVFAVLVVLALWRAIREVGHRDENAPGRLSGASLCFDGAVFAWGAAYCLGTLLGNASAGRIADPVWFGALDPGAALFEWLSMLLALAALIWYVVPRVGTTGRNWLLALASIGFVLLFGEGVARAVVFVAPAVEGFPGYSSSEWKVRYVRRNRDGYRDVDHQQRAATGVRRLLILGDSYAFGYGLEETDARFGEQLARLLAEATGSRWEPINVGMLDTHTLQQFSALRHGVLYRPDMVLLLYVFNDIDYLWPVTDCGDPIAAAPNTLVARFHPLRLAFKNSYLFQALYVRVRGLLWDRSTCWDRGVRSPAYADSALLSRHVSDIGRLVALADSSGAVAAIVPFDIAVTEDDRFRSLYDRFVQAAVARGLLVLSLRDAFAGLTASRLSVNRLDRHPNALANRLAARAVLPQLLRLLSERIGGRMRRKGS